jgi:hypothetical protein
LVVLEHGVMGLLLPLENDVEDRMRAVLAAEDMTKRSLVDEERARITGAVEDAGNEALPSQTPRGPASAVLAFLDLESNPVAGHRRPRSLAKASIGPAS